MSSRRDFLQKVTLPLAAIPFLSNKVNAEDPEILYQADEPGKVLRVAIMGIGTYGNIVARAMKGCTKAKLVGVISGSPSKVAGWQQEYGIPAKNCYNYDNYDEIKNNPDIDAVYVITPNALHKPAVLRVAKTGKHVICEKPMGLNAKECREMIDACKKANVKLLVGYRMHFEPNTLKIIEMRKKGDLGDIRYFEGLSGFRIGDPTQWRLNKAMSGGGSMMDIGIYSVNGARYMVGQEPIWVTAQEVKTDPEKFKEGIDETITFQFGFPNGVISSNLSSYNMNNLDRFFLNGSRGYAELHPANGYGPIKGNSNRGELNEPHIPQQQRQMDAFSDIIFNGYIPEVPVDGEEAWRDMRIIDAIYEAVKTGKKITLS